MTKQEYLNKFDVFFNNISSNKAPGLEDFEIEDITNKAYYDLVVELYRGSFEQTEESRRYLANLVEDKAISLVQVYSFVENNTKYKKTDSATETPTPVVNGGLYLKGTTTLRASIDEEGAVTLTTVGESFDSTSAVYPLPSDLWFITYECITVGEGATPSCMSGKTILVYPTSQDTLSKTKDNPFRGPNKYRALRLDVGSNAVELVSKYPISQYKVRYVKQPDKISLSNLTTAELNQVLCPLHEAFQQKLLDVAVTYAAKAIAPEVKS